MTAMTGADRASLRPVTPEDHAFLTALFVTTRDDLASLPDELRDVVVDMQFRAQDASYRRANPDAAFDVVEVDGRPVGRLYVDRRLDEIRIIDISLLPGLRGVGLGTALIRAVQAEAAGSHSRVTLHVADGNRAAGLYARLGFRVIGDVGVYRLMEWRAAG